MRDNDNFIPAIGVATFGQKCLPKPELGGFLEPRGHHGCGPDRSGKRNFAEIDGVTRQRNARN